MSRVVAGRQPHNLGSLPATLAAGLPAGASRLHPATHQPPCLAPLQDNDEFECKLSCQGATFDFECEFEDDDR